MVSKITINSDPRTDNLFLDVVPTASLIMSKGGKYGLETVTEIVRKVNHYCYVYKISPRIVLAQMLHETGWFKFGNDVQWWQFNFAGLGATGGIIGNSLTQFKPFREKIIPPPSTRKAVAEGLEYNDDDIDWERSIDLGVLAVVQHHMVYIYGPKENWPVAPGIPIVDPRYTNGVVQFGKVGPITTLKGYEGRWAVPGIGYAGKIIAITDVLPTIEKIGGDVSRKLRIVVAAGHHNTSGGHPREHKLVGPLTREYLRVGRELGHDMLCYTPQEGMGEYPGDLFAAASEVVKYHRQKPVDLYMEVHFQGLNEGSDAGRGHFIIHPDWGGDVDVDVRDTFGPDWARTLRDRTGMPIWTDGVMSEKQTGVGLQGYRLGVFRATEGIPEVTRCIIEHGSHTSPADRKIIESPGFNRKAVEAFYIAVHKFYGLPAPSFGQAPTPTPSKPAVNPQNINGFWITDEFWDEMQALGPHWYSILGPPVSGSFYYNDSSGWARKVQLFEKGALAVYPEGSPHGVPKENIMYVRGLFWHERAEALRQGKEKNLVAPGTQ